MALALAFTFPLATRVFAQVMVGSESMYANKDTIVNAVNFKDHTTVVAAVGAAGLVETLNGAGPSSAFAPVNAAFAALPPGTVDTLLKSESKPALVKVLTCHVVPGRLDAAELRMMIKEHRGVAMLETVEGESLTTAMIAGVLTTSDTKGDIPHVTTADVRQSNGVIHVVDRVLLPK